MKGRMRALAALLAASLLLGGCGGGLTAATMHLRKTAGEVQVSDETAKDVPLAEDLGLYSGYQVDTQSESYAWIDLDEVKLTKMDEHSQVEIEKDGKNLEILVKSGSIFFRVTEPLEDDETMTIRTADLLVGIRGTCGWVDADGKRTALLSGEIQCEAAGETVTVSAGEKAELSKDGRLIVSPLTGEDIPVFVLEELAGEENPSGESREPSVPEESLEAGPVVTLTMPVTAAEVQSYLYMEQVQTVIIQSGAEASTLVIGREGLLGNMLAVEEGKSLILEDSVDLQITGEPPVRENGGESRYYTIYNQGTIEVCSDVLCGGNISNVGTLKVGGTFTLAENMQIFNTYSDAENGTGGEIYAAQGIQCWGQILNYGDIQGGVSLVGEQAELIE